MMRYQRLSPECLPLANGRKSTILKTTCKENNSNHHHHHHRHHHHDPNGRIPTLPAYESKAPLRVRSTSNPSTSSSPDNYHPHHFPPYTPSTPEPTNTSKHKTHEFNGVTAAAAVSTARVESTLPQWGQNKRSRGSRTDSRSSGDDASGHRKHHPAKIQRRSVGGSDKQSTFAMPPPCAPAGFSGHSRGSNPRACTAVARDSAGVLPNRNVEERSTSVSRAEKRSSSTAEKLHKAPPGHHQMECLNIQSSSEKEGAAAAGSGFTTAPAEKVNLDLFEWPRIYLSLSRKEKEDDFLAMKGTKLPQRPKKRAKNIDKTLQYCFPGMWLSDLTRGRYEVREKKCVKKKRRGLKAMESMDSDSE